MIEQLKIYDVRTPKIRLGHYADGGYVVPVSMVAQSEALFSYGVGTDITFERDYSHISNKMSYSYDHTVERPPMPEWCENYLVFEKEGLSAEKGEFTDSFFSHYERKNMTGKVLLKMDIEEAEFDYFLNTDIKKLSDLVTGMVVEFHPLYKPDNLKKFFDILPMLNEYFVHCHLHGNNYLTVIEHQEYDKTFLIPHVVEMTYINKSLVKEQSLDMSTFPNPCVDRPNDLNRPEVSLEFLKDINML